MSSDTWLELRAIRINADRLWISYCRACGFNWEMGHPKPSAHKRCKCGSKNIEVVKWMKDGTLTIFAEKLV